MYNLRQELQEHMNKSSLLNLNSREYAKNTVHKATRVFIVRRENKTSTVHIARNMDARFKNVPAKMDKRSISRTAIKCSDS